MTISTWVMILAIAVGAAISANAPGEYDDNCWVNGVWTTPCPGESPWTPEPPPEQSPPN